jgi:hypothetical protein
MASNNSQTPCRVQNGVNVRPSIVGGLVGALIWAGLFGFVLVKNISVFTSLNPFLSIVVFMVGLGSISIFVVPLVKWGMRVSDARRALRAHDHVQVEARVIESRLHWYGNPRRNFTPAWSLKYEFEHDHITYQSVHFQFDHSDELMFGSVAAVKQMVAKYPEGSTVPGYFRSTTPTASGLSLVAVTLEPSPKSYTEEQCREQEMLP